MGGWTSVSLAYPMVEPPAISVGQLADFIERFQASGVTSVAHNHRALEVKLGEAIDQDNRSLCYEVPVEGCRGLSQFKSQDIDVEVRGAGIDLAAPLRSITGTVYRASVCFGCISDGATDAVHDAIGDGYLAARLFDWGFEIGPLSIESPITGGVLDVGWISLSLGGQGYMTDNLSSSDLVSLVRELPECKRVEELVRSFWSVPPRRPSRKLRKIRREMGQYWIGVSDDEPLDWFWMFDGSY